MKIIGLAALALAIAAPALAQTSPNGGIGSLTPPAPQPPARPGAGPRDQPAGAGDLARTIAAVRHPVPSGTGSR